MISLIKFSYKYLSKKKLSFFLLTLFLTIGFSLLLLVSIGKTYFLGVIESYFFENGVKNKIIVEQKDGVLGNFMNIGGDKSEGFSQSNINDILKIDGVKKVFKYSFFKKPSVIKINILGNYLESDAFFVGIDDEMLNNIIPGFKESSDNVPMVVSTTAYNSIMDLFFKKLGNNGIGKDLLFKANFNIDFGKSTLFQSENNNLEKIGKLVGFSDDVGLVFIGIPFNTLNKVNLQLNGEDLDIDKLYVDILDGYDQEVIQSKINKLGFLTNFSDDKLISVKSIINLIGIIISILIYIFLGIILYSIISFILLSLEESKKDNTIMFSLGVDKKLISFIYFLEGFMISFLGLILSLLLISYLVYEVNLFILNYNSNHFIINLPQVFINKIDIFNLLIFFVLTNFLFVIISFYKVYKTKYENLL